MKRLILLVFFLSLVVGASAARIGIVLKDGARVNDPVPQQQGYALGSVIAELSRGDTVFIKERRSVGSFMITLPTGEEGVIFQSDIKITRDDHSIWKKLSQVTIYGLRFERAIIYFMLGLSGLFWIFMLLVLPFSRGRFQAWMLKFPIFYLALFVVSIGLFGILLSRDYASMWMFSFANGMNGIPFKLYWYAFVNLLLLGLVLFTVKTALNYVNSAYLSEMAGRISDRTISISLFVAGFLVLFIMIYQRWFVFVNASDFVGWVFGSLIFKHGFAMFLFSIVLFGSTLAFVILHGGMMIYGFPDSNGAQKATVILTFWAQLLVFLTLFVSLYSLIEALPLVIMGIVLYGGIHSSVHKTDGYVHTHNVYRGGKLTGHGYTRKKTLERSDGRVPDEPDMIL